MRGLKKLMKQTSAQSILEYILLLGIVAFVLFAMNSLIRRGVQSLIKVTADEIGNQQNGEQNFNSEAGYLVEALSSSKNSRFNIMRQRLDQHSKFINERMDLVTNSISNLAFTPDQ